MSTVHRKINFQTLHQKCVMCKETKNIPNCKSQIRTVHRNRTLSRRYIRNVYCAQKQFPGCISEMCIVHRNRTLYRQYNRNVYCAQKQCTFQTVHQKYVLCTETVHSPDGTSKMCTVHRNTTFSRRYIRNTY